MLNDETTRDLDTWVLYQGHMLRSWPFNLGGAHIVRYSGMLASCCNGDLNCLHAPRKLTGFTGRDRRVHVGCVREVGITPDVNIIWSTAAVQHCSFLVLPSGKPRAQPELLSLLRYWKSPARSTLLSSISLCQFGAIDPCAGRTQLCMK